jgi:hypothetical protein
VQKLQHDPEKWIPVFGQDHALIAKPFRLQGMPPVSGGRPMDDYARQAYRLPSAG